MLMRTCTRTSDAITQDAISTSDIMLGLLLEKRPPLVLDGRGPLNILGFRVSRMKDEHAL